MDEEREGLPSLSPCRLFIIPFSFSSSLKQSEDFMSFFCCLCVLETLFLIALSFSRPSHVFLCTAGLQPYTEYSFVLVACTAAACGASGPASGRTLQASPAGRTQKTLKHLPGILQFDVLAGEVASSSSSIGRTNLCLFLVIIQR